MRSLSYSMVSTAHRCNRLYQYLFVDKLVPEGQESGDMKFGTALHLGLESILLGNDGIKDFDLFWNIEQTRSNRYGRHQWGELKDQGQTLLERFKRLHAKKYIVYQMEQRLYGTLGDIRVEGTPDFIGSYDGIPSIVDFKTSGYRYPKDKIQISEQLALYYHLARQSLGYEAKQVVYVVFVKGKTPSIQVLQQPIPPDSYSGLLKEVEGYCNELMLKEASKNAFPDIGDPFHKNRSNCFMGEVKCQFFDRCHNTEVSNDKINE